MGDVPPREGKFTELSLLSVLVVDDNLNMLRLVSDVLHASGVGHVETRIDGQAGLACLNDCQPDLIFVDWQMPQMDGIAFTKRLRHAAVEPDAAIHNPKTPIIMLTGRRTLKDVEEARQAGVNEFVIKPFTPSIILSRIQGVMQRPRSFVTANDYVGPDRRRRMVSYEGPMRRSGDPAPVSALERDEVRKTIRIELDALRSLMTARGAEDRQALQMCYRSMQQNVVRAKAVRDTAIEQASNALIRYMETVGGAARAQGKVVDLHMNALEKLLMVGDVGRRATAAKMGDASATVTKLS